jgi:hypothetical protein
MIQSFNPPNMSDLQKRALIVGVVFLVALVASAVFLTVTVFPIVPDWLDVLDRNHVGSLALLMLQHLTGGGWGLCDPARARSCNQSAAVNGGSVCADYSRCTLDLSPWTDAEELAKDPVVQLSRRHI